MATYYNLPIRAQYDPIRAKNNDPIIVEVKPSIQILPVYSVSAKAPDVQSNLADKIFTPTNQGDTDLSDFISGKVDVEKSQLQLLLEQVEVRNRISYQIQKGLLTKELEISSDVLQAESAYSSIDKSNHVKRMDALDKERNMEYVALWRDTQKILLEIMKHWSTHSSLERRSEVITSDL